MAPRARVFRIVAGYTPPSGSGSYQRARGRRLHRPRIVRSCSELAGISRRSRRRKVAGRTLDAQKTQFPPCPPPPDSTTNCPRDCIVNLVNIPISVVRWHDAAQETLSIYNLASPPLFVCKVRKSASLFRVPLARDVLLALACFNNNIKHTYEVHSCQVLSSSLLVSHLGEQLSSSVGWLGC